MAKAANQIASATKKAVKGDGYNDETVKKIVKSASNPLPERFTADEMMERLRRLAGKDAK
jgi:hypothetical protein